MDPLSIPLVVQKVVSYLSTKDLFVARKVSSLWNELATEECTSSRGRLVRKDINADQDTIDTFLDLMTSSSTVPIVNWRLEIDLATFSSPALFQFLSFIAPTVVKLEVRFYQDRLHRPYEMSRHRFEAQPMSLIGPFNHVPNLRSLEFLHFGSMDPSADDLLQLLKRIVGCAENLQKFVCSSLPSKMLEGCRYPENQLLEALPPRRIKILVLESGCHGGYERILDTGYQLEELIDHRFEIFPFMRGTERLVDFLFKNGGSLKVLEIANLQKTYQDSYPNFPCLITLKKVRTYFNRSSTFDFLKPFPNLVDFDIENIAE